MRSGSFTLLFILGISFFYCIYSGYSLIVMTQKFSLNRASNWYYLEMITFDEHPSYCCCLCMQSCCGKTSISDSLLPSFNRREPSPHSCPRPSRSIVVYTLVMVSVGVEYCLQSSSRWSHRPYSILSCQLHCIEYQCPRLGSYLKFLNSLLDFV